MRVRFLDAAKADLIEIFDHYREVGGIALARRMLKRIKAPTMTLKDYPELAKTYDPRSGIRRLVVADGTYLLFYRVRADVEILHVRRTERMPVTAQELEQLVESQKE